METESGRFLYHPPTELRSFQLKERHSWKDLKKMLFDQWDLSEADVDRILWHGGFYLDSKRLTSESLPDFFETGARVDLYRFQREPGAIPLLSSAILQEGEGWMAINKPPWLPVQGTRVSLRFSLQEELRKLTGVVNLTAIHRLDRETSGVVLFSKNKESEAYLMKQFHDQKVKKTYLAVVSPPPSQKTWKVEGYMVRDFRRLPQDFFRLHTDSKSKGKWSETDFEWLKTEKEASLVKAHPKTGRTHQIRIHLAQGGTPIVGDQVYGNIKSGVDRMQLHAHQIEFNAKQDKEIKNFRVVAPIPGDFLLK